MKNNHDFKYNLFIYFFVAEFNDNLQIINKNSRQERREHGEKILDKHWIISIMNIQAKMDFEERISELEDEDYLEEDNHMYEVIDNNLHLN